MFALTFKVSYPLRWEKLVAKFFTILKKIFNIIWTIQCSHMQFLIKILCKGCASYKEKPTCSFTEPKLFRLFRLRLSKSFGAGCGAGSDLSFLGTVPVFTAFKWKVDFSWFLGKNIDLLHFLILFKIIYDLIHYFTVVWPGAGSRSQNFSIPAPAPAKSFSSLWLQLWLHNTAYM